MSTQWTKYAQSSLLTYTNSLRLDFFKNNCINFKFRFTTVVNTEIKVVLRNTFTTRVKTILALNTNLSVNLTIRLS